MGKHVTHTAYLIVDRNGDMAVRKTRPNRIPPSSFAFNLRVRVPIVPEILGDIELELPEPPPCPDPLVHLEVNGDDQLDEEID